MIKIINESANNFDIGNMVFEINVWLPTLYPTETDKELSFSESWKLDRNLLIPDRKLDADGYDNMLRNVQTFVETNIPVTTDEVIAEYNNHHVHEYSRKRDRLSNDNKITDKTQSFAFYMDIDYMLPEDLQCSETVRNSLKMIIVRVANHISKKEFKSIENPKDFKVYHNQMIELCESQFKSYVNNILYTYADFIANLLDYDYIETISEIEASEISRLKRIASQGRFEEYERRYNSNI